MTPESPGQAAKEPRAGGRRRRSTSDEPLLAASPDAFHLRHRKMAVDVYGIIREKIMDGSLPPGAHISQARLARELGISRGPISDALSRLHERGLVLVEPNMRPRVAEFDAAQLDSLYGARITLESYGVRLTAARRDPETLEKLHRLLGQMTPVKNDESWRRLHRSFHRTLASGAGQTVEALVESMAERSEPYYQLYGAGEVTLHDDHGLILAAIVEGDESLAQQRHAEHLSRVGLTVLSCSAPEYEPVCIRAALRTNSCGAARR